MSPHVYNVCAHVCVQYMYTCVHVPLCVEARGEHAVSCNTVLCLISSKHVLSLKLELGWQPADPTETPVPALHSTRVTSVHDYTQLFTWVLRI